MTILLQRSPNECESGAIVYPLWAAESLPRRSKHIGPLCGACKWGVFVRTRKGVYTVCGGGRAAAAASGDLLLMRSVMGENREREGNRLGLHWQAHSPYALQYTLAYLFPHISMRLCFDLSPANDSKITWPLESCTSATQQPCIVSSFILPLTPHRHTEEELQWLIHSPGRNELLLCHHGNDHSFDYAHGREGWSRKNGGDINSYSATRIIHVWWLFT